MRVENWPRHLQEFIETAASRPFEWGTFDCVQFVGEALDAMTGINPVENWRGRYTTETGAQRIINRDYGGSLTHGWTKILGDPIPVSRAGRGDVVVVETDGVKATGIVDLTGERVACLSIDGLEFVPISAAVSAWKI